MNRRQVIKSLLGMAALQVTPLPAVTEPVSTNGSIPLTDPVGRPWEQGIYSKDAARLLGISQVEVIRKYRHALGESFLDESIQMPVIRPGQDAARLG